jgi:hypothetical protein
MLKVEAMIVIHYLLNIVGLHYYLTHFYFVMAYLDDVYIVAIYFYVLLPICLNECD